MNATNEKSALRSIDVRRRFDRAAAAFDDADFVHAVTRDGLLARLEPMTVTGGTVLDLGSGTGASLRLLKRRFRRSRVIAVDLSRKMLAAGKRKTPWFSRLLAVQADARALPFADCSADVVFSNLMLPWVDDTDAVFRQVARVLRRDGLFAFSSLGPDSLAELGDAWRSVDGGAHVRSFPDMHDVGDALVRAGLRDPVLDVDRLTLRYASGDALFRDMTAAGARNSLEHRSRGLSGKRRLRAFDEVLFGSRGDREFVLELEIVYGHCWGRGDVSGGRDVRIDPASIPLRRR